MQRMWFLLLFSLLMGTPCALAESKPKQAPTFAAGNHTADKLFDLQESTYWQAGPKAKKPLLLVIDLGSEQTVTGLDYLPRAEKGAPGSISRLSVYIY